jgi:predicted TIM-barrel fold metal-dependent hydrolase
VPPGETRWYEEPLPVERMLAHMERAGVDKVVLVHAFGAYGDDTRYLVDVAGTDPARARGVVGVYPARPGSVEAGAAAVTRPGVRGLRTLAIDPSTDAWLEGDGPERLWEAAAGAGVPLIVCARAAQLARLRETVTAHPEVPLVLDDCGVPELTDRGLIPASHPVLAMAEHPWVSVKVFSPRLVEAEVAGSAGALLDQVLGAFGADRVAWGSNFPQSGVADYGVLVEVARAATRSLAPTDREAVLGGTAERLWFGPGA